MITVDLFGNVHNFIHCTAEDVAPHFDRMKDVIPDDEHVDHQLRMQRCINEGSAYMFADNSCFFYYYLDEKPKFAVGVALQGTGQPLKILALFAGVFRTQDTETKFLRFRLHTGKFISEYKSLITPTSIQRQHENEDTLMVRVDKMTKKLSQLSERRKKT